MHVLFTDGCDLDGAMIYKCLPKLMYQKRLPKFTNGIRKEDLYEMISSLGQNLSEYIGIIVGVGYCQKELVVRVVSLAFSFSTSVALLPHPYPSNNSSRFTSVFPYLYKTSQGSLMLSSVYDVPFVIFLFQICI